MHYSQHSQHQTSEETIDPSKHGVKAIRIRMVTTNNTNRSCGLPHTRGHLQQMTRFKTCDIQRTHQSRVVIPTTHVKDHNVLFLLCTVSSNYDCCSQGCCPSLSGITNHVMRLLSLQVSHTNNATP